MTAFLYSRIVSAKWTFFLIALFCKIQLSQNVEVHFRSTIKNFSTNIVSKSKKFLMSKVRMRFLRFSQSIIQVSIWFLNDDCFNVWNFSCNYFFIWSSIFLYLMIKSCNISFMKVDIISKRIYDLAKTRIVRLSWAFFERFWRSASLFVCTFSHLLYNSLVDWESTHEIIEQNENVKMQQKSFDLSLNHLLLIVN